MSQTEADAQFQDWMRDNLTRAAKHFRLTVTAEPVFGWLLRSISAPANGPDGPVWLRVSSEELQWAQGEEMTGNLDANTLTGLDKPHVLDVTEWDEWNWRRQRAEVMTLMPGTACSPTATPPPKLRLPEDWWENLTQSLDRLRRISTNRINADQSTVDQRVRSAFGDEATVTIQRWETVHGDLHWGNLFHDPFGIIDWELWGTGPAGTDAATLYLYSLTVPAMAKTVHARFTDILDTPDGHRAQLYVAARLLHRSTFDDHPELMAPLHQLATNHATQENQPSPHSEK